MLNLSGWLPTWFVCSTRKRDAPSRSAGTDAGPLISLGRIDRLSLLLLLNLPIYLVDQVVFEVTSDRRFVDAERIDAFIAQHTSVVQVFQTEVGHSAEQNRAGGQTGRQKGMGEAAIAEFLARLDEVLDSPDDPVLLLYEDSDINKQRFVLPDNVHLLSTRVLLLGLEQRGQIASARRIWEEIHASGRGISAAETDRPARTPRGGSSW
jgi:hypothetical protein